MHRDYLHKPINVGSWSGTLWFKFLICLYLGKWYCAQLTSMGGIGETFCGILRVESFQNWSEVLEERVLVGLAHTAHGYCACEDVCGNRCSHSFTLHERRLAVDLS